MGQRIVVIPDTNVLLHSLPIDQIPWRKLLGTDEVLIVLVPQVLRELDLKKDQGSEKLKKRAQKILAEISAWYPPGTTSQDVAIADGIALRLRAKEPAPVGELDYTVFDDRIVGSAIEVRGESPERIVIISGDFGMRVKMEARGFDVRVVPDAYRIREEAGPKKEAVKEPRVVAALFTEDESRTHVGCRLGLSASHMLPRAEEELLAISSHMTPSDLMRSLSVQFGQRERTEGELRNYIEDIKRYDVMNANVIEFEIGVANVGEAPAEDVTAEFWFPNGLLITDREPDWPKRPAERLDLSSSLANFFTPHPLEQNTSFTLDWTDDGSAYVRIRVRRLMQSTRVTSQLWATIDDAALRGFPIESRVLVASPALTIETKLNVRIVRGDGEASVSEE